MTSWFTLQEYSNQQGVSISTLRRKIKSREIEYTFKNGRYLLKAPANKDSRSLKELQNYYQKLLKEKEENIQKLKIEKEDMMSLINFLETKVTQLNKLKISLKEK